MSGDGDDQRRIASIALAMVTMRVNTPYGHWVEETFDDAYVQLWNDAKAVAGVDADEFMFLEVMNLASMWLERLAEISGRPVTEWLDDQRREIDAMRFEGDDDEEA